MRLQQDINAVVRWTDTWLMRLNYDKCKVMHFGKDNPKRSYVMEDSATLSPHTLAQTDSERDLGITITSDAKWHEHANKIASKANGMLGWMKSSFMCRESSLWLKLYKTYIRPLHEFAAPVWGLYHKGDIERVEKIQRRATKVAFSMKCLNYEARLAKLELTTLEERRRRGNLIQMFKIQSGRDEVCWSKPLLITEPMRGRRAQLRRQTGQIGNQRHNFFTNRVAGAWNDLPDELVSASSVNSFKNGYDKLPRARISF
jgi:hypothetical protein